MIDFKPISLQWRDRYNAYLWQHGERGCEFTFANIYLWGRQRGTEVEGHFVRFSQFNRRSVYPYPLGSGDKKAVMDAIMDDARQRGIPCRITGLTGADMEELEALYPGKFRFHCDRGDFDYVYDIHDLADLKGRKYQKKRNHVNKFFQNYPLSSTQPLSGENVETVRAMVEDWYARRQESDPEGDYHMEHAALKKALQSWQELGMEGLVLFSGDEVLAVTLGSFLSEETFDVQFEKARADADGAYPAINQAFARYLREKYPALRYLNREEDMGLEGLRKAKLSYYPHHLVEKCWACLLEDGYEY